MITAQSLSVWPGAEGAKLCVYEAVNRAAAAAVGKGRSKGAHGVHAADASGRLSRAGAAEMTVAAQEAAQKLQVTLADESACVRCSHCACCDSRGACRSGLRLQALRPRRPADCNDEMGGLAGTVCLEKTIPGSLLKRYLRSFWTT